MTVATRPVVRTVKMNFRLSPQERAALDRLAAEGETTRTAVVAGLVLQAARGERNEREKEDTRRREAIAV